MIPPGFHPYLIGKGLDPADIQAIYMDHEEGCTMVEVETTGGETILFLEERGTPVYTARPQSLPPQS